MNFLRGLVTRHIFAKIFAIFFAVVTVYLVNRELEVDWYDREIPVVKASESEAMFAKGQPFVAVSLDQGVWVSELPKKLRLRLSGSAKERAFFGTRPMIELRVRSEWVDQRKSTEHALVESDLSIPLELSSARIVLREQPRLRVDKVVNRTSVQMVLATEPELAAGQVFDAATTRFEPAFVTVEGPQRIVDNLATTTANTETPLVVALPPVPGNQYRAGGSYRVSLTAEARDQGLRIVGAKGDEVKVILGSRAEEKEQIVFRSFPVQWRLRDKDLKQLAEGKLSLVSDASLECELRISGPVSLMQKYRTDVEKKALREALSATVDPRVTINELLPGDEKGANLQIQISGLPSGLEYVLPNVSTVTCRISLLEKG